MHAIQASFSGDVDSAASESPVLIQNVSASPGPTLRPTTTVLRSSADPAVTGQVVILTATVSPSPDGGKVEFLAGGRPIARCGAMAVAAGRALCRISYAHAGMPLLQAVYSGNGHFEDSQSRVLEQATRWSLILRGRPAMRQGRLRVTLGCAPGSGGCRTALRLATREPSASKRNSVLAQNQAEIAAGKSETVTLRLNSTARRLLTRRHQQVRCALTITLTVGAQHSTVRILKLRI